jgi:RimJ/RimL family protein N-acetyltransferase
MLKGSRIYLKEDFTDKELIELLKWFHDIEVVKYFSFAKKALNLKNKKELKTFCYPVKDAQYFTVHKNKRFIGYTLLVNFKNTACEIGITLAKDCWGKGYGHEAIMLTIEHAFNELKIKRIHLTTSEYNKRAIKLYKKIGFKITKKIQKDRDVYHNNKWQKSATICMEIKKKDYKK